MTDKKAIPHTPLYVILSGGIFDSTWSDGEIKDAKFPDYMLVVEGLLFSVVLLKLKKKTKKGRKP